jgi:glycosyltransferase involved in cell wall biosynthesis
MSKLLLLYPGPSYDVRSSFNVKLQELSDRGFCGGLITSAPEAESLAIGNFEVRCVSRRGGKLLTAFRFLSVIVRWKGQYTGTGAIVVTYDPLRTGLFGCFAKMLTGAKLAPEVNGDFADRANFLDLKNRVWAFAKRRFFILTEKVVLKRADGIKLLYEGQLDELRVSTKDKIVRVMPNWVSVSQFQRLGEENTLLTVGFPWQVKGIDVTIRAFRRIASQVPDWRLIILGWYKDTAELNSLIADCQQIEIRGPVKYEQMPDIIGRCGIFVLASRTETMGRVLIEAMAAGKPRVASRVGGVPTVVNDGVDGILFASEDDKALSVELVNLINDGDKRKRLGDAGAARAKKEFSTKAHFDRISEFYRQVLEA